MPYDKQHIYKVYNLINFRNCVLKRDNSRIYSHYTYPEKKPNYTKGISFYSPERIVVIQMKTRENRKKTKQCF